MKHASIVLLLAMLASAPMVRGDLIYGLTDNNHLVSFDSTTPGVLLTDVTISGASNFVDIDFYPVNGLLYALQGNGDTFTINTATGAASYLFSPVAPPAGFAARDFDFNPVADRIRISGSISGDSDRNFRMVPNVTTAPSAPGAPGTLINDGQYSGDIPVGILEIVGNAYTNNFDGAATTSFYSLDTGADRLLLHNGGPSFNTFTSMALVGGTLGTDVGFDIEGVAFTPQTAYVSNGNAFYTLDLNTAQLTFLGNIGESPESCQVVTIAAVPELSSALLSMAGIVLLGFRRRRQS